MATGNETTADTAREVLVGRASKELDRRVERRTPKASGYVVPAHVIDLI